ncbi:MAG: glycosyltransferase [Desulfomonile tiedjei]|nr:glycosyltransferase [Desulfomonile tiedjei]
MPLVSVIIPTYNRRSVLERAICSVLSQTFKDFELIVVDDGSQDSTSELLSQFDGKLKAVYQENHGVSSARNLGIRHAQGELLAFLDSDDEWLPDKLARQTAQFDSAGPWFVCHTDEIWLRDGNQVPQKKYHFKQGGHFFERALERCLMSPSSVMISRTLLNKVGHFDEELTAAEDYDLWLRITAFHEVHFVPEPLVIKHGGCRDQLSQTVPAIDRFRIRAIQKILAMPELCEDYRRSAALELIRKCEIVASGCERKGKKLEAEEYRALARSYQHAQTEPA